MRKYGIGIAVLAFAVLGVSLRAAPGRSRSAPSNAALQSLTFVAGGWAGAATSSLNWQITAYTLPSDVYKKAHHRSRIRFVLALLSFVYGLVVLWAMLHWKLGVKYRDWREGVRHLGSGMGFLELGLGPRAADLNNHFHHLDLASLQRDSEKSAALVVLFLADFSADHRAHRLYHSLDD